MRPVVSGVCPFISSKQTVYWLVERQSLIVLFFFPKTIVHYYQYVTGWLERIRKYKNAEKKQTSSWTKKIRTKTDKSKKSISPMNTILFGIHPVSVLNTYK